MTPAELELAFCEAFLWKRGLEPYPVQEQAFAHIMAGRSVMVTVPTGTGKTVMAKAALFAALERRQRAVYTTPLRALTEEKYRELCEDFGEGYVGFATGDYKYNRDAPIQVEVAEILWNRIYGDKSAYPADVVVMDEGHYFNDPERGYVWEQSIIGLDPRVQLIILSATVGRVDHFCHWVEWVRRVPLALVESRERRVPLVHEFREEPLLDVVRGLAATQDVPAIIFVFGRQQCFDVARLLKSCRRFTTDEERATIASRCDEALLSSGAARELRPLLEHGIGIHHAGILPRYKQLVEELTTARLLRFVVSTETIAAGINLPARTVVFPALRKFIKNEPRLVTAAEFHQMAGRAGRPQFDDRGLAIALAPEEVVSELGKEMRAAGKRGVVDEAKIKKSVYNRLRSEAQRKGEILWTPEIHAELVGGEPAELRSRTKITAEQVLALGLPDLAEAAEAEAAKAELAAAPLAATAASADATRAVVEASLPPSMRLNVVTVLEHLLMDDRDRRVHQKTLTQLVANLQAIEVLDAHGRQVRGHMIRDLQGVDGPFVYFAVLHHQLFYEDARAMVEFLIDHDIVQRLLERKDEGKKKEWIRARLRELRETNPQVAWEDAEADYDRAHPRELSRVEQIHHEFIAAVPHPELHAGKRAKTVWATMEDSGVSFLDFVVREGLEHEEGNLFTYLVRVMNTARKLGDATALPSFLSVSKNVHAALSRIDVRIAQSGW